MKIDLDGPGGDKWIFGTIAAVVMIFTQFLTIKIQSETLLNYKNQAERKSWFYEVKLENKSTEKELGNGWEIETSEDGYLKVNFKNETIFKISKNIIEYKLQPSYPQTSFGYSNSIHRSYGVPTSPTTGVQLYVDYNNGQVNCIDGNGARYGIH
jgi:hypothetical protein